MASVTFGKLSGVGCVASIIGEDLEITKCLTEGDRHEEVVGNVISVDLFRCIYKWRVPGTWWTPPTLWRTYRPTQPKMGLSTVAKAPRAKVH